MKLFKVVSLVTLFVAFLPFMMNAQKIVFDGVNNINPIHLLGDKKSDGKLEITLVPAASFAKNFVGLGLSSFLFFDANNHGLITPIVNLTYTINLLHKNTEARMSIGAIYTNGFPIGLVGSVSMIDDIVYPGIGLTCVFLTVNFDYRNNEDYRFGVTIVSPLPSLSYIGKGKRNI